MPVTITEATAAVAIRAATDADTIPPAVADTIAVLFPAAAAMVVEHAPAAPDEVQNAAVVRLLGWMYDADPTDSRISRAIFVSGASGILAQWRVHRAGAITETGNGGGPTPTPTPVPGGGVPSPPSSGHYILTANDGDLAWVEFPQP